jgi:hypothetical protein
VLVRQRLAPAPRRRPDPVNQYPPYLLARLVATLHQVSNGRSGWNIVTGSSDRAAQKYGLDALPMHSERYARGESTGRTIGSFLAQPFRVLLKTTHHDLLDVIVGLGCCWVTVVVVSG